MTRKENLLIEICRMNNRIAALRGDEQLDVEQYSRSGRFYREAKESRENELKKQLEDLNHSYERTVEDKRFAEARAAYYATPEGTAHKARLEKSIERKLAEMEASNRSTLDAIENSLRQLLGVHWGVKWLDKGYLKLGVIDAAKSTPEQREFFFGQYIDVRYDERPFLKNDKECFECNIGTCGGFDMRGCATVGERAMFYADAGKLLGDMQTIERLRIAMRDYNRTSEQFCNEISALHRELNDPFAREEAR